MKIKLKRSATKGKIPLISDLDLGEIAVNTTDGKLYMKRDVNGVVSIVELTAVTASSSGGSGGAVVPSAYASLLKFN